MTRLVSWLGGTTAAVLALGAAVWLLAPVLTPFILGFVIAYFLSPIVRHLERLGLPRAAAVIVIAVSFLCLLLALGFVGMPFLLDYLGRFFSSLPQKLAQLQPLAERFGIVWQDEIWKDMTNTVLKVSREGLVLLFRGGVSFIGLIGLLVVTPIVTIYLLQDWERMLAALDTQVLQRFWSRAQAQRLRALLREMDEMLAAFARGQLTVCLLLAVFYSLGLALVGLDGALAVGLMAGAVSFVPYAGAAFGIGLALILALVQFGADWTALAMTGGVFVLGQFLEGNILSPLLVGNRVSLHPVWAIFALVACGHLFGFLGILLALPLAAVLGVLVRFGLRSRAVA